MFHFRSRIAFGMDIRNLFEFECALKCNGEVITATKVNKILGVREDLREIGDTLVFA